MSVLSDHQIAKLAGMGMIVPFSDEQCTPGVVSYGLSSYGYDVSIGSRFKVFDSWKKCFGKVIDPKSKDWHDGFTEVEWEENDDEEFVLIPPNSFVLGESVETFNIPRDILVLVVGKSTYARCGLLVNVTPLEPEWQGKITIEISNTTPLPAKIYVNEGIAQAVFFVASARCERSYADKKGKYQNQTGLTMPSVWENK